MRTQSSGAAPATVSLGEGAAVSLCPTAELLESAASCAAKGAESTSAEASDMRGLSIATLCQRHSAFASPLLHERREAPQGRPPIPPNGPRATAAAVTAAPRTRGLREGKECGS